MRAAIVKACVGALVFLVLVWAFVSYLHPQFTGERAAELLFCR